MGGGVQPEEITQHANQHIAKRGTPAQRLVLIPIFPKTLWVDVFTLEMKEGL